MVCSSERGHVLAEFLEKVALRMESFQAGAQPSPWGAGAVPAMVKVMRAPWHVEHSEIA